MSDWSGKSAAFFWINYTLWPKTKSYLGSLFGLSILFSLNSLFLLEVRFGAN